MTTAQFPESFDTISEWSKDQGISVIEGRLRFAQYGVLRAVSMSHSMRQSLVFKGGNALDFIWQPNRSTRDLDFSVSVDDTSFPDDSETIATLIAQSLRTVSRSLGTLYEVRRVRQNPPGDDKTFITYVVRIGYALQDELRLIQRMRQGEPSSNVIPLEISINEVVCATDEVVIGNGGTIQVCTVEDILAEKLRALLQQTLRNRVRSQDLLDIAVLLRHHDIGPKRVATYLTKKSAARSVPVSRAAFRDPDLVLRTRQDYSALRNSTRVEYVDFDEALAELYDFVDRLAIP